MSEQIKDIEQPKSREKIARESLDVVLQKRNFRERFDIDELVNKEVFDLPEEIKNRITRDFNIFKDHLDSKEIKKTLITVLTNKDRQSFIMNIGEGEDAVEIPNKSFSNYVFTQNMDEILREEKVSLEDFKKIARVSFDFNGLKVVNDIGGTYQQGDAYLKMAVLAINDSEIKDWARKNNLEYVVSRDGGDEFGAVLKSDKPIVRKVLNEFINKVQDKLRSQDTKDILDFEDENVRLKVIGVTDNLLEEETVNELSGGEKKIYKQKELEEAKIALDISPDDFAKQKENIRRNYLNVADKKIPKNYFFRAEMSAAAATLYDGLMDENNKIIINKEQTYGKMMQVLMGTVLATSERSMHENKVAFKAELAKSDNPHDRFLSTIYNRSEKEKKFAMKIAALEKIEAARERHECEEEEYYKSGGSWKGFKELKAKQKEEIMKLKENL